MPTFTATTALQGQEAAQALADSLETLMPEPTGIGVAEVQDGSGQWEVSGYFIDSPDIAGLDLLAVMKGAKAFVVLEIEDRDWVAEVRRELTPVHAGRFVVFGGHDAASIPTNKIGLEIEAAMAFGTGHHGTTQGCLMSFDKLLTSGVTPKNIADIGSGTGVLAMAAAKVTSGSIIASDIDPIATATALDNVAANGLRGRVRCVTSVGFRHETLRERAPYDLIFANILAGPLKRLAPDMAKHTGTGSVLILSGILNRQALGVEAVYKGWGFIRLDLRVIGEWSTLTLQRG
ncbi:MAG: 50S ribosomal protein L11 methyltransferase [Rhodobacteraceae bacterium]|nr:50S ribosomal protein L11 methyltransferase [Paracoccaceae bacterium]